MSDFIIFIFFFFFLLFSIIGYGIIFQKFLYSNKYESDNVHLYVGFYGLLSVTFLSLLTSLFTAHDFNHNIILHLFGFIFFIYFKFDNKKKYLVHLILLSLLLFSALLISKTHDDFPYYHLPFTKYLTEHKVIFGMGHLNHGYNLLSSLFFLNSTFYLPYIKYFSFHFTLFYFLIFFNYYLLCEIFSKKSHNFIIYLYLFSLIYFNLSFNRLSEYGTDKVGQILIVLLIIKLLQLIYFQQKKLNFNQILYLAPLLALCISLKTYFISYVLLALPVLFYGNKKAETLKKIILTKTFLFFLIFLSLYFSHHFISTGCLISPIHWTCFDNFDWARETSQINKLSKWLEQWSKAGAGPNYSVDNPAIYVQYFNWVTNWIDKYFITKFIDQLVLLFFIIICIFFTFKNFEKNSKENIFKKILPFYIIIIIIFFIWFYKHPTLRYGGYSIYFLTIAIPVSCLFCNYNDKPNFIKRFKILFTIIFLVFNLKNVSRIYNEINRTDEYTYKNFPFYAITEKEFTKKKFNYDFIIYSTIHHCWASPTPCGSISNKIDVKKKNGYLFIYKSR